jgi:hypothetical protein
MTMKEELVEDWAKRVGASWKHIPSLKGKQASRNLIILRLLETSSTPKSVWDLALDYLKHTEKKFGVWDANKIYRERMKENAKMNRRLKFLEEKKYVKKLGSVYKLTGKGTILLFAIDPQVFSQVPASFFDDDDLGAEFDVAPNYVKQISKDHVLKSVNDLGSNSIKSETLSFIMRKAFLSFKINMDEIGSQELVELLGEKLSKAASIPKHK